MATPSRDALIGQLVAGRYEVLRLIGRGGTGSIYEVRNVRLGHSFALKTLTATAASNPEAVQRFRREADIVARIKHPNIVEVIDWDELPDGSPCIVMEYLRGIDLAGRIKERGQLPWPQIAVIADQMLAALTTTHSSGVVHRDLKPQNVFLAFDDSAEERVKLLDFGVSKIQDSTSLQTQNDRLVGTPSYMAPEQAEGRSDEVGPHTDIWAMGIILHEMATGVIAFDGPSLPAILYAVCHGEPAPITKLRPDAPAAFVKLIEDALQRPIAGRLADVAVLRGRLREALRGVAGVDYSKQPAIRVATAPPPVVRARSDEALADTLGPATPSPAVPAAVTVSSPSRWPRYAIIGLVVVGAGIATLVATRQHASTPSVPTPVAAVVMRDAAVEQPAIVVDATVIAAVPPDARTADAGAGHAHTVKPMGSFVDQVTAAIGRRMGALGKCIDANPDDSGADITATIDIAPTGHATSVTLAPAAVATSALGGCLRARLLEIDYPPSVQGGKVAFPLRMQSR